jgi:hypothetical protein
MTHSPGTNQGYEIAEFAAINLMARAEDMV